ncbi:MAG: hypothetical protein KC419_16860 [Anaerolineales bacterium]|nr:hypothetical protein [Anaerolineales bacterium]
MGSQDEFHITSVIALHGIAADGDALLIGVQIDQHTGWGMCTGLFAQHSDGYNMAAVTRMMHTVVAPALKERPFTTIRDLFQRIDALTETITEPAPDRSPSVSRRQILAGQFHPQSQTPPVPRKRPLPPALRFGIGQAALQAAADARQMSPVRLITANYELKQRKTAVGIHLAVTDENMHIARPILRHHVKSVGYQISRKNPQTQLGTQAEHLQKLVSELAQWLQNNYANYRPFIHINLQGAFTNLFGSDTAAALTSLQALQKAAAPLRLRIENIYDAVNAAPTELFNLLTPLVERDEAAVQIVASCPHYPVSTVAALVQWGKIDGVHLDVTQVGSLDKTIKLIGTCQEKGIAVMLSGGGTVRGVETAVHLAAATGAEMVAGPPDLVHNELQRLKF